MALPPRLLFLTLNTFSSTGGIERVCRVAGKALYEESEARGRHYRQFALYDAPGQVQKQYLPPAVFRAFSGRRLSFIKAAVAAGRRSDTVLLSHVNLLVVGFLIQLASPRTRVVLLAHGIEVWKPVPGWKRKLLRRLHRVLPVSGYTRTRMEALYGLQPQRLRVVNNGLDPYLPPPATPEAGAAVRRKLGLSDNDLVLFTLTRLQHTEQYKGYDRVIEVLPDLLQVYPQARYVIAGKYDSAEKARLDRLIREAGVKDRVVFTGFVPDAEIAAYYAAADVYIMPSTGEGFGIVFIEALHYGKPVIAGNVDGSVDAVDGGRLGLLVNPGEPAEILQALQRVLENKGAFVPAETAVQERFGFARYRANLAVALDL